MLNIGRIEHIFHAWLSSLKFRGKLVPSQELGLHFRPNAVPLFHPANKTPHTRDIQSSRDLQRGHDYHHVLHYDSLLWHVFDPVRNETQTAHLLLDHSNLPDPSSQFRRHAFDLGAEGQAKDKDTACLLEAEQPAAERLEHQQ